MSILIRGREMPENCQECVCLNDEYFYCQAVDRQPQDENVVSRRPDWCPLIEVSDDKIVLTRDEFAFYSRCMLVALELRDLLAGIRLFEEKLNPNGIKGNAPTISEAEGNNDQINNR